MHVHDRIGTDTCDAPAYSGLSSPGLTTDGTYDRVIWNGEGDYCATPTEVVEIVEPCLEVLRRSERSRLVVRTRSRLGLDMHRLRSLLEPHGQFEIASFPRSQEDRLSLTIGINKPERSVDEVYQRKMMELIRDRLHRLQENISTRLRFTSHARMLLREIQQKGMTLGMSVTWREIFSLWGDAFGWTTEQCRSYAERRTDEDRVFVLRDDTKRAIAGMLFSNGESTEWCTVPEHQGKGLIVPLLIFANCHLIRDGIKTIWAETRWDRSTSPAIRAGFEIDSAYAGPGSLLANHVTIGRETSLVDPPDQWNRHRGTLSNGTNGRMFRSFALSHLNTALFTDDVMDVYLSSTSQNERLEFVEPATS